MRLTKSAQVSLRDRDLFDQRIARDQSDRIHLLRLCQCHIERGLQGIVSIKSLRLLYRQSEGRVVRCIECWRSRCWWQPCSWVNDESTEVGLQFMLFRELPTQTGHSKSVISRIRKTQISLNCGNFVFSRKLSKSKEATYLSNLRGPMPRCHSDPT